MSQVAIIGVLGLMICCSSSSAAMLMMGGDDDTSTTGPSSTGPAPSRECTRTVTVTRTDSNTGWGMPLEFKCGDETINVGPESSNQPKTVGPYELAADACPPSIDKNNWLGGHTYGDTFDIKLSECIDLKTCPRNVTATRTDSNTGWGMPLEFKCGDQTVAIGPQSSGQSKTTAQPVNINQIACPSVVDKSNWLGGHTYGDTFDISVSDCVT
jgi:hypothetical protein